MMARSGKRIGHRASGVSMLLASAALLAQDGEPAPGDAAAPAASDPAVADGAAIEERNRNPQRCISTTRLDRTEVVDDETVLFFMRGGDVYRNRLSRSCPGLEREKRFTYRVYGNQLCRVDTITVLESRAFGLTDGFTCALGDFQPISVDEAERLTGEFWPPDVEIEAVELPKEDAEESDDEAAADAKEPPADGAAERR
jgi:hypothetical protein